ncbi:MAG TPA: hypothetical protein VIU82_15500, partial [Bosea sp. (in: a-proteobacteria)]
FGGGLSCDDPAKNVFDIHGGGIDLVFPHHENEIAQSCCAFGGAAGSGRMANYWMHNGFLQVEGEKMSKSLGNFVTINELLETDTFGGRKWPGEVLRLAMLKTHYRQPIDWTVKALEEAEEEYFQLRDVAAEYVPAEISATMLAALSDDLNTHEAITELHQKKNAALKGDIDAGGQLRVGFELLGLGRNWDRGGLIIEPPSAPDSILAEVFGVRSKVDVVRDMLRLAHQNDSISRLQRAIANTDWNFDFDEQLALFKEATKFCDIRVRVGSLLLFVDQLFEINAQVAARLAARRAKNFAESDRIRDELAAMGIALKDGKDPATGEPTTTWEVKR